MIKIVSSNNIEGKESIIQIQGMWSRTEQTDEFQRFLEEKDIPKHQPNHPGESQPNPAGRLNHQGQRMTQQMGLSVASQLASIVLENYEHKDTVMLGFGMATQYGVVLPYSRGHETEAEQSNHPDFCLSSIRTPRTTHPERL